MKFKPLCHDYHSEATHLLLEEFPHKPAMKPLRIHISPEFLDQDENDDEVQEAHGICEKEDEEEESNEQQQQQQQQQQEPAIGASPLMDSTNQEAMETPMNSRIAKSNSSKKSKGKSSKKKKTGTDSNKSSRRRRKKRRRDSVDLHSPPTVQEKPLPEAPTAKKDQTPQTTQFHESSSSSPTSIRENPLQGDPRKGQRRWRRRKILSNHDLDLPAAPSFEMLPPRLEADFEEEEEEGLDCQEPFCEHESMDLDSSPKRRTIRTLQLGDHEMEECNSIVHHDENAPQDDMSVEPCGSDCSSSAKNQRVRRRKRRLVHAICKSTIGSKGIIIVLPPRRFTIYDSPFLVSLWTNIRRCANRKRIANYDWWGSEPSNNNHVSQSYSMMMMMDENATKVAFWRQPTACPQFQSCISFWWRRRTEITIFRQFSRCLSNTAASKLDHILSLLTLRHLSSWHHQRQRPISIKALIPPKKETTKATEKESSSSKLPYRYCLLDILQGNAGTFSKVSLGSSRDRRETRKRELQAIVPYASSVPQSSSVEEVQRSLEFAILLAMNVARKQDDGNNEHLQHQQQQESDGVGRLDATSHQQPSLPAKRKAVDRNEGLALKKRTERKLVRAENDALSAVRNKNPTSIVNDDPRLPPPPPIPPIHNPAQASRGSQPPIIRNEHSTENATMQPTKVVQRQKDMDQARKTELSLLERFGLAPDSEPTEDTPSSKSIQTKNKPLPEPTISTEEVHQSSKKEKQYTREHAASKPSGLVVASHSTVQGESAEPMRMAMKERNSFHPRLRDKIDENKAVPVLAPLQEPEKQSSVAASQGQQPSSCQPMSEVTSDRKVEERNAYYRNWQPKNFDLDDESVLSFNNNNNNDSDSDIQVVAVQKTLDPISRVPGENLPRTTMESPSENMTEYNAPVSSKPQAASRVVTEKKKRKRARKAAKKNKDHKRKSKKRKKKKKAHGELFDQPFPESVLQSLEEDAFEEQPHTSGKVQATPRLAPMPQANRMENGSPDQPIVIDGGSDVEDDANTEFPKQPEHPPLLLLCSEDFLESWGDTAARLVSGDWQKTSSRSKIVQPPPRRFLFVDTNLVDTCGVDIELPNRGGIVVAALSSWNHDDGFNALIMRIVSLISTTRFRYLSIYLCADTDDQDDAMVDRMATLQNAVLHQGDGLITATTFTLVSPNALAASIGQSLFNLDAAWGLEEVESWLHDDRTFERLLFLVRLIPTLTATSILQCLMSSPAADRSSEDRSRFWFQSMFHQDDRERKRMQSSDPKLLHPAVAKQLSFALGVNVSDETVFRSNL